MRTLEKSLFHLSAEDVMSREVRTIPQEMSLPAAARMLAQDQITGAPVVDDLGRCVGVLSATDFVHWAQNGAGKADALAAEKPAFCSEWQVANSEHLPKDEVRCHMSTDPVTAAPETRMTDLARMMLDAHIHRIIVVDADRRPVGIVSSTDVLAAVAYADHPEANPNHPGNERSLSWPS